MTELFNLINNFQCSFLTDIIRKKKKSSLEKYFPEIVERLLELSKQDKTPIDLEKILPLLKIHPIQYSDDILHRARLLPIENGFQITIDKGVPNTLQRTAIAHEVGHILFYDTKEKIPKSILSTDQTVQLKNKIEWYCYKFGRELLCPTYQFTKFFFKRGFNPSLKNINLLKYLFLCSFDIITRRIYEDFHYWPKSVIFQIKIDNEIHIDKNSILKGQDIKNLSIQDFICSSKKSFEFFQIIDNSDCDIYSFNIEYKKQLYLLEITRIIPEKNDFRCLIRIKKDKELEHYQEGINK
jgi:Zn-dependent peptidase ImmA (M78 family)